MAGNPRSRGVPRRAAQFPAASGLEAFEPFAQMVSVVLPPCDGEDVQRRLREEHAIEVPVFDWEGRQFLRVSVQGYNSPEDLARLTEALPAVLRR